MNADDPGRWLTQSEFSDPGPHRDRYPTAATPAEIGALARNLLLHYRDPNAALPPERLVEADSRWVEVILDLDAGREPVDLAAPRPYLERVAGCCRDFTLVTVSMLRAVGIPARSRIGFADYFGSPWHNDHVVTEFWDGSRWVWADTQLDPTADWGFDAMDLIRTGAGPRMQSAAEVWLGYRAGTLDVATYGVDSSIPFLSGAWFVRDYVLYELAHRQRDELLLWDSWGAQAGELVGDEERIDELARLLLAGDAGDADAEEELAQRYRDEPDLAPGATVQCMSPVSEHREVSLRRAVHAS